MLITKTVKILRSKDPSLSGRVGTVVLESKNTLSMREAGGLRLIRIPKSIVQLSVRRPGEPDLILDGSSLLAAPEERIKG